MKKWLIALLICGLFIWIPTRAWAEETDIPVWPVYTTNANLNLRESPTTESALLETVPRGNDVWVTDFLDYEWYAVVTGEGRTGYMKAEYLTERTQKEADAAASVTTAETSIGTVEMPDWADAKAWFKIGVPAQVIDVRTKITYWVASFSNGKHADVEPVTTDDTAAMKRTYGGSWSWDTRPVIVIISGHTMAASISGMPHGGGVNSENGMNGQVCIHFKGSRTHNGNKAHENDHQAAVQEAFNTASNW